MITQQNATMILETYQDRMRSCRKMLELVGEISQFAKEVSRACLVGDIEDHEAKDLVWKMAQMTRNTSYESKDGSGFVIGRIRIESLVWNHDEDGTITIDTTTEFTPGHSVHTHTVDTRFGTPCTDCGATGLIDAHRDPETGKPLSSSGARGPDTYMCNRCGDVGAALGAEHSNCRTCKGTRMVLNVRS